MGFHHLNLPEKFFGVGEIRYGARISICSACLGSHNPGRAVIRPLHGAVLKIIAIEEAHLIPAIALTVRCSGKNLYSGIVYEIAEVCVAIGVLSRVLVDFGQYAGSRCYADVVSGGGKHRSRGQFRSWLNRYCGFCG